MDATLWKKFIDFEYEVVKGRKPIHELILLANIFEVTAEDRMKQRDMKVPKNIKEEDMWEYFIEEYRKEERQRDLDFIRYRNDN